MLKEIKRQAKINRANFAIGLVVTGTGALFVGLIANIAAYFDADASALPPVGSLVGLAIAVLYAMMLAVINTPVFGDMGIKFGAVRRRLFPAMMVVNAAVALVLVVLAKLWVVVDALLGFLFNMPMDREFLVIPWYFLALAVVAVGLVGTWIGALLMQYGKKAFWVLFTLYMVVVLFGTRLLSMLSDEHTGFVADTMRALAGFVSKMPIPGLALLGILVALAIAAHSWFMLRKAAAR